MHYTRNTSNSSNVLWPLLYIAAAYPHLAPSIAKLFYSKYNYEISIVVKPKFAGLVYREGCWPRKHQAETHLRFTGPSRVFTPSTPSTLTLLSTPFHYPFLYTLIHLSPPSSLETYTFQHSSTWLQWCLFALLFYG